MGRILDRLPPSPRPVVLGHELDAVEDAHALEAGNDRDRAARYRRRHRVVVQVETHVGRLADVCGGAVVANEAVFRQTEQVGALAFESVADQLLVVLVRSALRGRRLAPLERLLVQVIDIAVLSRRKEARADLAFGWLSTSSCALALLLQEVERGFERYRI